MIFNTFLHECWSVIYQVLISHLSPFSSIVLSSIMSWRLLCWVRKKHNSCYKPEYNYSCTGRIWERLHASYFDSVAHVLQGNSVYERYISFLVMKRQHFASTWSWKYGEDAARTQRWALKTWPWTWMERSHSWPSSLWRFRLSSTEVWALGKHTCTSEPGASLGAELLLPTSTGRDCIWGGRKLS